MRFSLRGARAAAMVAALAGAAVVHLAAEPFAADEPVAVVPNDNTLTWKTVASSGPVDARTPETAEEAWAPLERGDRLDPSSLVRTGRRGRATLARTGDILIVDPESTVELPDSVPGEPESSVIQSSGSVIYEVDRRDGRDFKVVTPYLVAGVKGTTFMVTVTDASASVTVEEGLVEVWSRTSGESMDIGPGESVRLEAMADAEIEHVTLNVKRDRNADGRELRRLARADLRRLGRAVAQRHELILDEDDLDGDDPSELDPELERNDLDDDVDEDLSFDDLDEDLDEDLSADEARKNNQAEQTPVQPE